MGGVRTLLQDEKYSDVREKFIAAQSNPAETQKLAISLRDDVEKLGIKTSRDIPEESESTQQLAEFHTLTGSIQFLGGSLKEWI